MSKQLLTYQEFKEEVDFYDNVSSDKFNKYEKVAEKTYLSDLIGADLVTAIKAGAYDELLPYIKDCLAHECELYFIRTGPVITTGNGGVSRDSTYSKPIEWTDKQAKIDAILTILRSYETALRTVIEAGTYTDYNDETTISKKINFNITPVGD